MKKLLSASEIAALQLPDLPTTKVGVRNVAEREQWYFEERTGVGGTRRVYEVPAKYLPNEHQGKPLDAPRSQAESSEAAQKVVGTIVAGTAKVDTELLQLVVRTLREWSREQRIPIPDDREAALIAVLYDYISKGATKEEVNQLLKVVK